VWRNTSKSFTCYGLSDFVYRASYQAPLSLCNRDNLRLLWKFGLSRWVTKNPTFLSTYIYVCVCVLGMVVGFRVFQSPFGTTYLISSTYIITMISQWNSLQMTISSYYTQQLVIDPTRHTWCVGYVGFRVCKTPFCST
jgi:hypothetical protein